MAKMEDLVNADLPWVIELDKIRHENKLNFQIQVDGGISDENAGYLIQAGSNNLVAGSYIFSEPNKDYAKRINKIRLGLLI